MLYTILQIIAFQALFLLVYDLFLKRETFFNYNRAYLLITTVLAIVLPFIKLPKLKAMTIKDAVIQLPEVFIGSPLPTANDIFISAKAGIILEPPAIPLWQYLLISGALIALLLFSFKLLKLYKIKHSNPKRWRGNVLVVSLIKSTAAFSFFNTIFIGECISETDKPTIFRHELVHIKEWHTLDLLLFELLRIVLWFNPLVYLYQNRIKELHEYIADEKSVKQHGKSMYYQNLLNQIFDLNTVSFTNTFVKKTLIKKRIAMLQQSKSKQLHLFKYALVIPVVFCMLIYTSTEVKAQGKDAVKTKISQELTDQDRIDKYYKEMVAMEKNGATFFEIATYGGYSTKSLDTYMISKDKFLKSKAYMKYIAKSILQRKTEAGTLTKDDVASAERMQFNRFKTYNDYKAWKNTDEAKAFWETNAREGVLRLFVSDLLNMTTTEQERYETLKNQLFSDKDFHKLIITDGKTTSVLSGFKEDVANAQVETEAIEVPFSVIEEVPTLEECKDVTANAARKKCMSDFIAAFVNKRFNIDLADSLNLRNGRQRIFVAFKINKEGNVIDVKARAAHPDLETEAKRVINLLPQFIPGKQKGKTVTVPYALPIIFRLHANEGVQTPNYNQFIKGLEGEDSSNDTLVKERLTTIKKYIDRRIDEIEIGKNIIDAIPLREVDLVPAYVDCELITANEDRKKCTSNGVSRFVNQNFNLDHAIKLGIKGRQEIYVSFIINKEGNIADIKVRASHPKLEEEATRVIAQLPQFVPGVNNGNVVDVAFALPIIFQIN